MDHAATAFWLPIFEIIWIDILLSGDNALVIALACRSLPTHQRKLGILVGSGAAIALRTLFTVLIAELLGLPFVRIAGGIVLLWIAIKFAGPEFSRKEVPPAESLWSAIRIIALADAAMSLDNMVAIAAVARGSIPLILLGLALSIPLLISGSAIVLAALNRFPILVWAGALLLGGIAGDLAGSDANLAFLHGYWPGCAVGMGAWQKRREIASVLLCGSFVRLRAKTLQKCFT
jgi:YjbE family integral membrane protein